MKKNYKVFGNEPTNLVLSEKAMNVYSNSSFKITEESDGSYSLYDGNVSPRNEVCCLQDSESINYFLEELAEEEPEVCARFSTIGTYSCKNGFYFDVIEDTEKEEISAWLYHEDVGIKDHMFGVRLKNMTVNAFVHSVTRNLDDYIESYSDTYITSFDAYEGVKTI